MTFDQAMILFMFAMLLFQSWLSNRWERAAWLALRKSERLRQERDCLAQWLSVNGWQVEYRDERVIISRGGKDPEEERLKRSRR